MPTSLLAIAKKAQERKDTRFFNLYRLIDENLLLECWGDIRKNAAYGRGSNQRAGVRREPDRQHPESCRATEAEELPGPSWSDGTGYQSRMGRMRPLGIPVVEDKLLQLAVTRILEAIYEQDFLRCSYGYRPKKGALDAVDKLTVKLQFGRYDFVVEADIQGFFDNLNHEYLVEMLSRRIGDRQLLRLIQKWLKAGVLETDGQVMHPATGNSSGRNCFTDSGQRVPALRAGFVVSRSGEVAL
jgi:hypothetical protein